MRGVRKPRNKSINWNTVNVEASKNELVTRLKNSWYCRMWLDDLLGGYMWAYYCRGNTNQVAMSRQARSSTKLACEDFCKWYNSRNIKHRALTVENLTRVEAQTLFLRERSNDGMVSGTPSSNRSTKQHRSKRRRR